MNPSYELLSRLLAGDLPGAEARALRERIRTDPEWARAWSALQHLSHDLASLPEEVPPPSLDAAVLGSPARRQVPWATVGTLATLAAAVALWIAWPAPEPARIALVAGEQTVDGAVVLLAGDLPVTVDGRVHIRVEPNPPVVREPGQEVGMKTIGAGVGGVVVGALVTVGVMQGTATVGAPGDVVELRAGEQRTFRSGAPAAPPPPASAPAAEQAAWLQAENDRLRQELENARLEGAVARGQVTQTQGVESRWPAQVPAGFAPAEFEANVRAAVAKVPELQVESIDCAEYPCVATFSSKLPTDVLGDIVKQGLTDPLSDGVSDQVWLGIMGSDSSEGSAQTSAVGLALLPPGERDDALHTRTDWRAKTLLESVATDE